MDNPRTRQIAFNAASRNQWDRFHDHRARVTKLLCAGAKPESTRLCVLGAGNTNDLDLSALLNAHREVHLVDLDRAALEQGIARQGVSKHSGLRCFGGIDLTGRLDASAAWSPTAPVPPTEIAALVEWPSAWVARAFPGPYDHVASTCLLSQLAGNAFAALGKGHPQFAAVVQAIRLGHLRLLPEMTVPRGTATLITDVVSTDTFPGLASLSASALRPVLPRLAREGNFIYGVHPEQILHDIRHDPILTTRLTGWEAVQPWRWNLHARTYLVWAVGLEVGARRTTGPTHGR